TGQRERLRDVGHVDEVPALVAVAVYDRLPAVAQGGDELRHHAGGAAPALARPVHVAEREHGTGQADQRAEQLQVRLHGRLGQAVRADRPVRVGLADAGGARRWLAVDRTGARGEHDLADAGPDRGVDDVE